MALGEFVSSSAEQTLIELEGETPRTRRVLCFGGRKRHKHDPSAVEPYDMDRLPDPIRHYWKWEKLRPVCLSRLSEWESQEYDGALVFVNETGIEFYAKPKTRMCCGKMGDVNRRLDNAVRLPSSWSPVGALCPIRDPQDLQNLLDRCELQRTAGQVDHSTGGNLMYYAASKGDSIVCQYLVDIGLGHLAAHTAFDGLTAFEVAIAQGYPDTAFIIMPYSGIRNVAQGRFSHNRLLREMQYVVEQDGTIPKDDGPHGLLAVLTNAYTRTMSMLFGSSHSLAKQYQTEENRENEKEEDSKEEHAKRRRSRRVSKKKGKHDHPAERDPSYTLFLAPTRCTDLCTNCGS